jgi:hypothetical protein
VIWVCVYTILFVLEVGFLVASIVLFKILIDHQQLSWVLVYVDICLIYFPSKIWESFATHLWFFPWLPNCFFLFLCKQLIKGWIRIQNTNWKSLSLAPMHIMLATSSLTHLLWNLLNSYHYLHRTWQIEDVNN